MGTVRDENFLTPEQINSLPCFTANRFLQKVDESVQITQVCVDSNNTSLVIIDFTLVGAFLFTPYLKILSVDGDFTYQQNGITAPMVLSHANSPDNIPIDTECGTYNGQIVFDFGSVIPNFAQAGEIWFELGMIGQSPQAFGVTYPEQTPVHSYTWHKSVLPSPISITHSNGSYNIVFEYKGSVNCDCAIQCVTATGLTQNIQFCPNQTQEVQVFFGDFSSDPSAILLEMQDSAGSRTQLNILPLIGVVPSTPTATLLGSPSRISVGINYTSIGGVGLNDSEYQILKYVGSPENLSVWKDWSSRGYNSFVDVEVLPNKVYGYAVRYRGPFSDMTNLSVWTTVNT